MWRSVAQRAAFAHRNQPQRQACGGVCELIHNFKPQHANHLIGFRHYLNLPIAFSVSGEVGFVRPGLVALVVAAADVEGDFVKFFSVVKPLVIDAFAQSARCMYGGVGVNASMQLRTGHYCELLFRSAAVVIYMVGNGHLG